MKKTLLIGFAVIILVIAWDIIAIFLFGGISLFHRALWMMFGCVIAALVLLLFKKASRSTWLLYVGVISLVILSLPDTVFVLVSNRARLDGPIGLMMLAGFPATIIIAALLFHAGFTLKNDPGNENTKLTSASLWILGLLILLKLLDSFYRLMVWDTTYDPLGFFWLAAPTVVVLFAGMALLGFLPGNKKWIGAAFFLLIPAFIVITDRAAKVDFRQLTDERAERVRAALDAYHAQEGVYPKSLGQLIPRYALSLSNPVILFGQDWCYEGGDGYYRLGYLYRDHWSSPILYGKIHTSSGKSPSKTDVCQPAIDRYQEQNPGWKKTLRDYGYPTPTPDFGGS